jgi:hypothetical protein
MRNIALGLVLGVAPVFSLAQSAAPFNRYLALAEAGKDDTRIVAFAHACYDTEIRPVKQYFYTEQNDWLPAKDLSFAFAGYDTGDANTAEVWSYAGYPRVIYLWEVDLEYQRDTLFCLNKSGDVTKALSRFFPSESGEPREHWIYIHTVKPGQRVNLWESVGVYEDAHGKRLDRPDLSSEDRDFIAGERSYHYLNDFDFASLLTRPTAAASAEKDSHATP